MQTHILIRFDDICPTMNWEQWSRAAEIMERYHIKPLIGVIPDCKDPDLQIDDPSKDFWEYVRRLQNDGFAIAMHGYQHVYDRNVQGIVNQAPRSEFAGHTYEEQYEKIRKGKEILQQHGIETEVFFAPSHSYDENTLRALAANEFRYLSDGKSAKPFKRNGIICIPCRPGGCPRIKGPGYYTAVFHAHEWVRADKAQGYDELVALCKGYTSSICDFDMYNKRPKGQYLPQLLSEKLYLMWIERIKPILRKIRDKLID